MKLGIRVKKGTICALDSGNTIFSYIGRNYKFGYPYADKIVHNGRVTMGGGATTVDYTNKWHIATPEEIETWNKAWNKVKEK